MFSRRTGELNALIARAMRLDLYERLDLEGHIARALLEYVSRAKADSIDRIVETVRPVCDTASYLGLVCTVCRIVERVHDMAGEYGLSVAEFKSAVRSIAQVLDVLFQNAEERYMSVVGESIPRDSKLLVVSYSARMERVIPALAYKFERVYVPVRDPMKTGVQIAEHLRRRNVNVAYIPDHSLAWAVREADIILLDAIGIAAGDKVIADAGSAPAIALARARETTPIVIVPLQASCVRRAPEATPLPSITIESLLGGPKVKLSMVDLLDPKTYKFMMATENAVQEASRALIRERVRVVEDIIDDTVQSTLDSMI